MKSESRAKKNLVVRREPFIIVTLRNMTHIRIESLRQSLGEIRSEREFELCILEVIEPTPLLFLNWNLELSFHKYCCLRL